MKILSFGHIPTWAGGRQESGLANVIYQLAKYGSEIEGAEVVLAATDCFVPERLDGKLMILGWTKGGLVKYIKSHPFGMMKSFFRLKELKMKYPISESFIGLLFKRLFFEQSVKRVAPQIVHLHGIQSVWYMDLVPPNAKVVVTFHGITGLDGNLPQHDICFLMERDVFMSKKVDGYFFICTKLVQDFEKAYGNNGRFNRVIFNSYDKTKFYYNYEKTRSVPIDRDSNTRNIITLYTVASLSDLKGQMRVLKGLSLLSDYQRFRYYCIGGDNSGYSRRLEEFAEKHDISFKYLGKMTPDEIRSHLYEADYMIMPSSSEGFGLTYLESIACGVPVLLPKDIPIAMEKELINENNSILIDDCSAESIARLLSSIDDYHFNHEEVANTIAGFSWDKIAKQYYSAFSEL